MSTTEILRDKSNKLIHVLDDLVGNNGQQTNNKIPDFYLGKEANGVEYYDRLHKLTLIGGSTGSGKSLYLETFILDLARRYSPSEVGIILLDPKRVQFSHFEPLPHLISPIITNMDCARYVLEWLIKEMERRYYLLVENKCRYTEQLKKMGLDVPHIVIVIDELAEILLTEPVTIEKHIVRLAQLSKSVGIHLVISIQRPSDKILTKLIKDNADAFLAFFLVNKEDSKAFFDYPEASSLNGKGDMLYRTSDLEPIRVQAEYISTDDISSEIKQLSEKYSQKYDTKLVEYMINRPIFYLNSDQPVDELVDEAIGIAFNEGKVSSAMLQRKMQIGYARAARLVDELEKKGIIGPADGANPRVVISTDYR